jgi:peptidoglycan/LPS O-acetylase OafA/YrhL
VRDTAERQIGLDLARTLAILGVVLVHSQVYSDGRFGVQLFFMLSGYLLVKTDQKINAFGFITRRALRLLPLYWFFWGGYYLLSAHGDLNFFLIQFFLIQNLIWWVPTISGAWSISNEWLYSLIVIPLQKMSKRAFFVLTFFSWILQIFASLFNFSNIFSPANPAAVSWLNTLNPWINLTFFLVGIGLKRGFVPIFKSVPIAFLLLILLSSFGIATDRDYIFMWTFGIYLILSLCLNSRITFKPIVILVGYIGQRTYSIFFLHFIVLDLVYQLPFFVNTYSSGTILMRILSFAVILIISMIFSEVTWRLIERPSIALARKLTGAASGI